MQDESRLDRFCGVCGTRYQNLDFFCRKCGAEATLHRQGGQQPRLEVRGEGLERLNKSSRFGAILGLLAFAMVTLAAINAWLPASTNQGEVTASTNLASNSPSPTRTPTRAFTPSVDLLEEQFPDIWQVSMAKPIFGPQVLQELDSSAFTFSGPSCWILYWDRRLSQTDSKEAANGMFETFDVHHAWIAYIGSGTYMVLSESQQVECARQASDTLRLNIDFAQD